MNSETKICQNCQKEFRIEPEDFAFYEKIKVPPPTWCPECRRQRRLAFVNFFNLYKRKCDLCEEVFISMYPPGISYKVYCPPCWHSDRWDPYAYGRDYDFSRPFFEQTKELWQSVPLLGLSIDIQTSKNAPYNNNCNSLKNCYLLFYSDYDEDCQYGFYLYYSKNCFDSTAAGYCELCYDMRNGWHNNHCVGTENTIESVDCYFLRDSVNCRDCFASANLRNAQYQIFNKQYDKGSYEVEMKKWDLGSYRIYQMAKEQARAHWKQYPPWPIKDQWSKNVSGNYVFESRNCQQCFEVIGAENCKYMFMITKGPTTESYDISGWGEGMQLSYECTSVGLSASGIKFSNYSEHNISDCEYCVFVQSNSANMFGCVSISNGQYSILNKRYLKEDFFSLRERIVRHMDDVPYQDKQGRIYRYGDFFPIEIGPHAYSESIANTFFPLSREEIEFQGYGYQEPLPSEYKLTLEVADLPDHILDVKDSILQDVIGCKKCRRGFKVTPQELLFLRNTNLPLPRECPFCRIQDKFERWAKQLQLVDRICSKCDISFKTPYTIEEYPKVWCKACYQNEVI